MFVEFADLRCECECFRGCWKSGVVKGQRRSPAAVPGVRCVEKDEVELEWKKKNREKSSNACPIEPQLKWVQVKKDERVDFFQHDDYRQRSNDS